MAERPASSPSWPNSTYHDELGGDFIEPDGHPPWVLFLFWAVSDSAIMKRAVFAVWVGCGPGKWAARLAIALFASACLYGVLETQLSPDGWEFADSWRRVVAPFAAIPLELLSLSAPFAVFRVMSGRRLRHRSENDVDRGHSQFSIADIFMLTAVIATSLALASWKDAVTGDEGILGLPASVAGLILVVAIACLYVLPLVLAALMIQRPMVAICTVGIVTVAFGAVIVLPSGGPQDPGFARTAGIASGLLLTLPLSMLVWRCSGYRLMRCGMANTAAP